VTSIFAVSPHTLPTEKLDVHFHGAPTLRTMRSASLDEITVRGRADDTTALGILSLRSPSPTHAVVVNPPGRRFIASPSDTGRASGNRCR
jgi:hypothetical protein